MEIPMPKTVLNCTLTSTQGKYAFDPVSKILSWEVGKIDGQKLPNIRGSVSIIALINSFTLGQYNIQYVLMLCLIVHCDFGFVRN